MDASTTFLEALPLLIPIIIILMIPVGLHIWLKAAARRQEEMQKTLRAMIESGQTVSPEILEQLALTAAPRALDARSRDLRWGIKLCGIGVAWTIFGILWEAFAPDSTLDDVMQWVAFGSIFIVVGVMRLALWKCMPRSETP